jgi:hypothetical protein
LRAEAQVPNFFIPSEGILGNSSDRLVVCGVVRTCKNLQRFSRRSITSQEGWIKSLPNGSGQSGSEDEGKRSLVDRNTRVIIQGATGKQGQYHTLKMLEYNARVVAGITPGKEGMKVHDIPIYDTVAQAKKEYSIDASMIVVPPSGVLAAALDAIENGIPLVVIITEFVPFHDTLKIRPCIQERGPVGGPNTIGVISPGKSKVGIMPGFIYGEGHVESFLGAEPHL